MIESTFQLVRGVGPGRERTLWRAGATRWCDVLSTKDPTVPRSVHRELCAAIAEAESAYQARDVEHLASLLPSREHWRLCEAFAEDAVYLDIETSDDAVEYAGISAIGVLDRSGPKLWLAGRDLRGFLDAAEEWKVLVTFNGLSFDVPVLRRAFPDWQPPACHVDLRHVLARLGYSGGLKAIERSLSRLNLARPAHLDGIDGWDAGWLYRRGRDGDRAALRTFAEYNLYDAINLRTLAAFSYNEMLALETADVPAVRAIARTMPVPERGEVLYDVSKILLAL